MILVNSPAYAGFINPSLESGKFMIVNGEPVSNRVYFEDTRDVNTTEASFKKSQNLKRSINIVA